MNPKKRSTSLCLRLLILALTLAPSIQAGDTPPAPPLERFEPASWSVNDTLAECDSSLRILRRDWSRASFHAPPVPAIPVLGKSTFQGDDRGKKFSLPLQRARVNAHELQTGRARARFGRACETIVGRGLDLKKVLRARVSEESVRAEIVPLVEILRDEFKALSLLVADRGHAGALGRLADGFRRLPDQLIEFSWGSPAESALRAKLTSLLDLAVATLGRTAGLK